MSSVKLTKPTVPFAEGSWQSGMPSPYFNKPSHLALREYVRQWTEDNLIPFSEKWDDGELITRDEDAVGLGEERVVGLRDRSLIRKLRVEISLSLNACDDIG